MQPKKATEISGIMITKTLMCKFIVTVLLALAVGMACYTELHAMQQQGNPKMLTDNNIAKGDLSNGFQAAALQKILSVDLQHVTLEQGLKMVARKAGVKLVYSKNIIPAGKQVSLKRRTTTLENALWALLAGTNLRFGVSSNNHLVIMKRAKKDKKALQQARQETITGTVTDASSGNTLPGVNILVKGTSTGTSSDTEGNFELTVESLQDTLVVSFIGYQTQDVPIQGRTEISIEMQSQTITAEEMVVVGYGMQRKENLTSSVSTVSGEEISEAPVTRVDQALQGKIAGVQVTTINGRPGSGTSIRIRGGNSISANNEPLYVIDGFVGAGGLLNSMNPQDIESIEVLKDATATSIYGARGANGVILITTKRGNSGDTNFNFSLGRGVQELVNKIDLLEGPERAQYANEDAAFKNSTIPFPDLSEVQHNDWIDQISRSASMTDLNLSVSGGNEDTRYYLSGNLLDEEGIIKNSGFTRYSLRLNADKSVTDWFDINTQLNIGRTKNQNNTVSFNEVLKQTITFLPFYQEDGSFTAQNPITGSPVQNPIAAYEQNINNTFSTDLLGNIEARMQPARGVEVKSTFGFDIGNNKTNRYAPSTLPIRAERNIGGFAAVNTYNENTILNENTVTYQRDINANHSVDMLGGFTYQNFESEFLNASGAGYSNDVLTFNNLSAGDPLQRAYNTGAREWTILSYLGRIHYNLNDKYLATIVARRDGSSRLAKNNKWAFFPSASVAWRLSEEDFMAELDYLDNLKLRMSYGKTGNQAIGVYQSLPSLSTDVMYFNAIENVGFSQGNIAKPDLKWETTNQFDVGLDGELFGGRLGFQLDYYHKKTTDLLLNRQLPSQTGYNTILDNIGEVKNNGLELMLTGTPIQTNDFSWETTLNISGNRNEVIDLGGREFIDLGLGSRLVVGEPAAVFVGAVYEGTWNTQEEIDNNPGLMSNAVPGAPRFKDVNGNGTYDGYGDYAILGSAQPDFYGGLRNVINFRNWELDFLFQFSSGNEIYNQFGARLFYGGFASNIHAMAKDRWTPENTDSDIPRAGTENIINVNSLASSPNVQDGSFIRLRTLRLTYDLPIATLGMSSLNRASIYLMGRNLLLFDSYDWGWDPEVSTRSGSPVQQGFGGQTYPNPRTFEAGININF